MKIVDFGPLDESATKGTLFTYEELQNQINDAPEFRFIGEEIGIQPKAPNHFCIPQEINEFFQSNENATLLDIIQRVSSWYFYRIRHSPKCSLFQEVENQRKEHGTANANASDRV